MLQTAQEHHDKVESRMDELLDKRNDALWRVEELNTDLEYTTLANERRADGKSLVNQLILFF